MHAYLQQCCLLIGSTPYDDPVLSLFYGQVDITEEGCSDVGVSELVYVGLGDMDEYVLSGAGVGSFDENTTDSMARTETT